MYKRKSVQQTSQLVDEGSRLMLAMTVSSNSAEIGIVTLRSESGNT